MTQDFNGDMMVNVMALDQKGTDGLSDIFDIDNLPEHLEMVYLHNAQLRESFFYSIIKEHSLQQALEQAIVHLAALSDKKEPCS
ncbi:MAG: hypothetical protein V7735_20830 [Photobacterium frigidiphilum]|uniref:hypothetical protein n=1 Tax=Photobacterium frigidiphilum TaxID=264736 RepID=UPI003002181B